MSDSGLDTATARFYMASTPGEVTDASSGAELISTTVISPYQGQDFPWRVMLRDNAAAILVGGNNTSLIATVAIIAIGMVIIVFTDRLLAGALQPYEMAVHSAAERLQTAEVSRVATMQMRAITLDRTEAVPDNEDEQLPIMRHRVAARDSSSAGPIDVKRAIAKSKSQPNRAKPPA